MPSSILVLMPKCPACFAGYIAIATGLGVSMSVAAQLRAALIGISIAALLIALAYGLNQVLVWWDSRRANP
ncbi:MAG: hypothetical protein AMXMBFR84_31600 [Candidatus Hydrogenedentota bacterium]